MERRPLPGFEGYYDVSDEGEVRRIVKGKGGTLGPLRPYVLRGGYPCVYPSTNDRRRQVMVHTAVAAAFLGPRPAGHTINHKNGIKTDNRAVNLEYVTPKENSAHAAKLGLIEHGSSRWNARLAEQDVAVLRRLYAAGVGVHHLAVGFAVSPTTIRDALNGRTWKHVA